MTHSDQTLLDRFASTRDGESFAELVRRHSGMVYGVCRRVLQDGALAEDAAQETFLHLLRHPAAVSESLVGWLHRVAHHKAVDLVRREISQARRAEAIAPATATVTDEEPTWVTLSPLLDEALQELPDEARAILIAHYLEARSQEQLAQDLKLSQPTVSRRLAAAVVQLRALLLAKGVVASVVLTCLVQGTACASAPATLALELGKLTLAGQAGLGLGLGAGKAGAATIAVKSASASVIAALTLVALTAGGLVAGALLRRPTAAAPAALPALPHPLPAWRFVHTDVPAMAARAAPAAPAAVRGATGPARLLALSRLGATGADAVIGVAIAPDWSLVVAGNAGALALPGSGTIELGPGADAAGVAPARERRGYLARLSADGRTVLGVTRFPAGVALLRLRSDAHGDLLLAGRSDQPADLGGGPGSGGFIAKLGADARTLAWILYQDGIVDHAADADGDLLALTSAQLIRYDSADGHERWHAGWGSRGPDHPAALAVDGGSGVAVVAGCSEASTGDGAFSEPYAHAFDRAGAALWTLWDADPARLGGRPQGLHLNAEAAAARLFASNGVLTLGMVSTGGNTMLARDARDPARDPAPTVLKGVHQPTPGYGFSGATPVSTLLRVHPAHGTVMRQTWISSWRGPAQAGAWALADACADGGVLCAVGAGGPGAPQRDPWFPATGESQAGGSIVIFNDSLRLLQAGTFPLAQWRCAALRGGTLIVAGTVGAGAEARTDHPFMDVHGDALQGYVAVFTIDRPAEAKP